MSKLYKFNIQTMLNGFLFGTGTYTEDKVSHAKEYIEQYVKEQKTLPYTERHIPPYFEIIGDETEPDTNIVEQKVEGYYTLTKEQLLDECLVRGFDVNYDYEPNQLIEMLANDDEQKLMVSSEANRYFISSDEFSELKDKDKLEYLDALLELPEGIDEGSDEELTYYEDLSKMVTNYGSNNVSKTVSKKIKEILEYCNS